MEQYRASLRQSSEERLLFESHMKLCATQGGVNYWRAAYQQTEWMFDTRSRGQLITPNLAQLFALYKP